MELMDSKGVPMDETYEGTQTSAHFAMPKRADGIHVRLRLVACGAQPHGKTVLLARSANYGILPTLPPPIVPCGIVNT
jgi:hypothetical protein